MAQLLGFPLPTKSHIAPKLSAGLHKEWLPSQDVKVTTKIPALNKRRAAAISVVCSLGGKETTTTTPVVKEPESVPAGTVLGKSSFPEGFSFGSASSAYQIEGAWNEDGKKPSIWDTFTQEEPHKIHNGDNGNVAIDFYHRYEEDIQRMKAMGVDSYRFSISWSRILPDGTGQVNPGGIKFYNKLINKLLENGITPYVTLFHWDVPQALEDKYGGFRSSKIIDDFTNYAKICYKEFGGRVKHWITLNEPWTFSMLGYSLGRHAPGRCTPNLPYPLSCRVGNSSTECYIVGHNLLLAHAKAARLYMDHFKALQRGEVGITNSTFWYKPHTESSQDKDAVQRALDFMFGWFTDPLSTGDYPFSMKAILRERLPYFTEDEKNMIRGSYDFIGLNYYSTNYAYSIPFSVNAPPIAMADNFVGTTGKSKDDIPIGDLHGTWVYMYPDGIRELLLYIKERYNNPKIYITENGTVEIDDHGMPSEDALHDEHRVSYMSSHLALVRKAIQDGSDVRAYFAWSFTDNFEWNEGFAERFGLYFIDYKDDLKRYPKSSVNYYTKFLHS